MDARVRPRCKSGCRTHVRDIGTGIIRITPRMRRRIWCNKNNASKQGNAVHENDAGEIPDPDENHEDLDEFGLPTTPEKLLRAGR